VFWARSCCCSSSEKIKTGCLFRQPVGDAENRSAQQVVLGERAARTMNLRIAIDIITDIVEIIIAFIKTDSVFIGSSLPHLFFPVNRNTLKAYMDDLSVPLLEGGFPSLGIRGSGV
jgi:hypothetical protein